MLFMVIITTILLFNSIILNISLLEGVLTVIIKYFIFPPLLHTCNSLLSKQIHYFN